ncbi:hypothetical protein EC900091_2225, partial [Escherichia coli 90.0091]
HPEWHPLLHQDALPGYGEVSVSVRSGLLQSAGRPSLPLQ